MKQPNKKRAIVTGGAGFIGSHLVDALIQKGWAVVVIDNLSVGKKEFINKKATFFQTNIQDAQAAKIITRYRPHVIFHLAAQKNLQYSLINPIADADTNIIGSLNLLKAAAKIRCTFIFYSTAAVYSDSIDLPYYEESLIGPLSPYGITKWSFEQYLRTANIQYSILRLANVYGPRQDAIGEGGVVSIFSHALANGRRPTIYNSGNQTRDFIYVNDVVAASLLAMTRGIGETFNISTAKQTSIKKIYSLLSLFAQKSLPALRGGKRTEQFRSQLANAKAKKALGWTPSTSLNHGLKETYEWFAQHSTR